MARQGPDIIAVGGGKGGAGRSTTALALAAAMAKQGAKVLLVDTETAAPTQHIRLELPDLPPPDTMGLSDPRIPFEPFVRDTPVENMALMSFAFARHFPFVRPKLDALDLLDRLRQLTTFTHIVLDLPSGNDPVYCALLALSDLPILVVEPEHTALVVATQYARACVFHSLGFHPDVYRVQEEIMLLLRDLPLHLNRATLLPSFLSAQGRRVVRDTCSRFVPALLFNKLPSESTPETPDDLGAALALAWYHLMGVYPRILGSISRTPNAPPSPTASRSSNPARAYNDQLDALAERVLNREPWRSEAPRPVVDAHSPHGILGLHPNTEHDTLHDRLERTRDLYLRRWRPLRTILTRRDIDILAESLDRALTTLLARHHERAGNLTDPLSPAGPPHATPSGRFRALMPDQAPTSTQAPNTPDRGAANPTLNALDAWLNSRRPQTLSPRPPSPDASPARPSMPKPTRAPVDEDDRQQRMLKARNARSMRLRALLQDDEDDSSAATPEDTTSAATPPTEATTAAAAPTTDPIEAAFQAAVATADPPEASDAPETPSAEADDAPPAKAPSADAAAPKDTAKPAAQRDVAEDDAEAEDDEPPARVANASPEDPPSLASFKAKIPPKNDDPPPLPEPTPPPKRRIRNMTPHRDEVIDPPPGSPGERIRNARREQRVSLRELSLRTKIGVRYLEAIETVDRDVLPRPVYLRGYLREIALVFDMDAPQLIEDYFRYLGQP